METHLNIVFVHALVRILDHSLLDELDVNARGHVPLLDVEPLRWFAIHGILGFRVFDLRKRPVASLG